MLKLKKLSVSLLSSDERVTIADRLVGAIPETFVPLLNRRSEKTLKASEILAKALNAKGSNAYTLKLDQADQVRDNAYMSFKYGVLGAARRQSPAVRSGAEVILDIMKNYDSQLHHMGYIAQTSEMKSLIQELQANIESITNAGLIPIWDEMKEAAEAFEELYQDKLNANLENTTPLVMESRKVLDRELRLLLDQVSIFLNDKEEGIEVLIEKFNQIITEVMTIARARQTREELEEKH